MIMNLLKRIFAKGKKSKSKIKTILIIDDFQRSDYFKSLLKKKNYELVQVKDQNSGIKFAKENATNLIIANSVIAGEKSIGLCGALKKGSATQNIPLIVFADEDSNIKSIEFYAKKVDFFMTFPITKTELLSRVEKLIRKE